MVDYFGRLLQNGDLCIQFLKYGDLNYGVIFNDKFYSSNSGCNNKTYLYKVTNPDVNECKLRDDLLKQLSNKNTKEIAWKQYIKDNKIPSKKVIPGNVYVDSSNNLRIYYGKYKINSLYSLYTMNNDFSKLFRLNMNELLQEIELLKNHTSNLYNDYQYHEYTGYLYSAIIAEDVIDKCTYKMNKSISINMNFQTLMRFDMIDQYYHYYDIYKSLRTFVKEYKCIDIPLKDNIIWYKNNEFILFRRIK